MYSCNNVLNLPFGLSFKTESLWILSRNNTLSQTIINNIQNALSSAGVNIKNLQTSDQSSCISNYPQV